MTLTEMDESTLKTVFEELVYAGEDSAALMVARMIIDPPKPVEWTRAHMPEFTGKIQGIKRIRAKFGLGLKEAKGVYESA